VHPDEAQIHALAVRGARRRRPLEYDGEEFHGDDRQSHDDARRTWIEENSPWMVRVVRRENIFGRNQDFHLLLPRWLAEARRTLAERLGRGRWYDGVGD
jgi:hypothetical protein